MCGMAKSPLLSISIAIIDLLGSSAISSNKWLKPSRLIATSTNETIKKRVSNFAVISEQI